jgi:hypothetical protein
MTTITLANKHFTLGLTAGDQVRRESYFRDPSNPAYSLVEDEQRILDALGIDAVMETSMRPYLAKFFDALPGCQTDASMILSSACEIPYYVIWSTQFGARQASKDRFETNKRETRARTDIEMAQNGAIIDGLKPVPVVNDIIREIFTVQAFTPVITAPAKRNVTPDENTPTPLKRVSMIDRVFTLIPV